MRESASLVVLVKLVFVKSGCLSLVREREKEARKRKTQRNQSYAVRLLTVREQNGIQLTSYMLQRVATATAEHCAKLAQLKLRMGRDIGGQILHGQAAKKSLN